MIIHREYLSSPGVVTPMLLILRLWKTLVILETDENVSSSHPTSRSSPEARNQSEYTIPFDT